MRDGKVVKVDNKERWLHGIVMFVLLQPVINNFRKVVILEVIHEHGKAFFDMLFNDMLNYKPTFTGTWAANDQQSPERINNIYPAFSYSTFQIITSRKVDGIFVGSKI